MATVIGPLSDPRPLPDLCLLTHASQNSSKLNRQSLKYCPLADPRLLPFRPLLFDPRFSAMHLPPLLRRPFADTLMPILPLLRKRFSMSSSPCWLHSRIHQQSGHRTQDRLVGNVIVAILSVPEHAGATEDEVDNLPAAFTLRLARLLQSQPRVHLAARGTSGKVRSLCDLPIRADYGQPPERVHLSGWRSQSSPRSFPRSGEC